MAIVKTTRTGPTPDSSSVDDQREFTIVGDVDNATNITSSDEQVTEVVRLAEKTL